MSIEGGGMIGIEAGGLAGAVPAMGDLGGSLGRGMEFVGPRMGLLDKSSIINESTFKGSIADFNVIRPVVPDLEGTRLPLGQLNVDVCLQAEVVAAKASDSFIMPPVITQAEEALYQAQKPAIFSPVTLNHSVILNEVKDLSRMRVQNELGDSSLVAQNDKTIEPMVMPFPKPEATVSPAIELAVQIGPQTEAGVATEVKQVTATQHLPEEQEVEETVVERVTAKQIDTVKEEETEESRLRDVVDEEVLSIRIKEFVSATDIVGAKAKEGGSKEIDGNEIAELVPVETAENRSGLIKKRGPDGSRVETIEDVASRKFSSVRQAKEQIMAIITRKVPVKRGKDGKIVGYEAVARVLKYFFVKTNPVDQIVTRVIKKQAVSAKERQKPSLVEAAAKPEATGSRIENLGLAEVFPKH